MTTAADAEARAGSRVESDIPVEEVAKWPMPGMIQPVRLAFSPDDRLVTFLYSPNADLTRYLYAFDTETGEQRLLLGDEEAVATEENLSPEEKLRRERQRMRGLGITSYAWSKKGNRLLLPLRGGVTIMDGPDGPAREIVSAEDGVALDARFSPDGRWVSYVQNYEIYVVPLEHGPLEHGPPEDSAVEGESSRQLTFGAREAGVSHGLAEFIAQEEMSRSRGYWWSPDSSLIAFAEVDERHIPLFRIMHLGKNVTGEKAEEDHRYPFAGEANARVRLGVVPIDGGEPVWMELGEEEDNYLARVQWLPDGRLTAQIQNREQSELELMVFDPATGQGSTLLREQNDTWINLHHIFRPLKSKEEAQDESLEGAFIWASERSGFRHLYLFDREGELIRPLTQGEWMVESLAAVDEKNGQLYFTATKEDPTESHLYAVSLDGGEPRRLTHDPGMHAVVVDQGRRRFVDVYHSLAVPPRVSLRSLSDGSLLDTIFEQTDPRVEALGLQPPEMVTVDNRDGVLLYAALYRPKKGHGHGKYPTIVSVYGGPGPQKVSNSWGLTADMRAQYLRSLGFLVFVLDNRGSGRRGLDFEGAIKHRMGQVEVQDQVDGVKWLINWGMTDPDRVGIYGWSYGGYMAAMCLAQAPEIFKVAVAGAPVTHYDGYDTHYTERYMGTPQSNPQGYEEGSVMHYVDNIQGKLLLVHGLIDENVHFRHTARLINALIRARKPYDLLLFPDERHSPRSLADRTYLEERVRDYFLEHL